MKFKLSDILFLIFLWGTLTGSSKKHTTLSGWGYPDRVMQAKILDETYSCFVKAIQQIV